MWNKRPGASTEPKLQTKHALDRHVLMVFPSYGKPALTSQVSLSLHVLLSWMRQVRKLLEKGSPHLNRGDKFGQTPLHIACHKEGLLGCLKLLAAHHADLEALDANGNTALHSAAGSGAAAAAEFLLAQGLSVNDRNNDGHTPIVGASCSFGYRARCSSD